MWKLWLVALAACGLSACALAETDETDAAPGGEHTVPTPHSDTLCNDGIDNDGDGLTDCDDKDCFSDAICASELSCADTRDNDRDGAADCADQDCDLRDRCEYGTEITCNDGFDNNADGILDCADPDCDGIDRCQYGTEASCRDHYDNDSDGAVDCDDADCNSMPTCLPETICDDGEDSDEDGLTDCRDPDCDGVGPCEHRTESTCDDGHDNDGDGTIDCDDADCRVLVACAVTCPSGSTMTSFAADELPIAVPDRGYGQAIATVADGGIVTAVFPTVSIVHTYVGDLKLSLRGPSDTVVALANNRGEMGAGYAGTIFSDAALVAIADGRAPFTGSFRPEEPLVALTGAPAAGDWVMTVADEVSSDSGSITGFTLMLCTCHGSDGCEFGAACLDGRDNDGDGDADCDDVDCDDVPQCASETACADRIDDDLDGLIDCRDPECDGLDGCEYGSERTCDDDVDNDGDDAADCFDADCRAFAACAPEADCHDGTDNDGDGTTDCADPGCAPEPTCNSGEEINCSDGIDNDGDGVVNCDEPACELGCAVLTCAEGEMLLGATASDLPLGFLDVETVSTTAEIEVPGLLSSAAMRITALHTYLGDLAISLVTPSGAAIDVTSHNGSPGDSYIDTVFIDSATRSIVSGSAQFSGQYRPEQPFATVAGRGVQGSWRLDIFDDADRDTGWLTDFDLALCVTRP